MKVLVCGGREYHDRDAVCSALNRLHEKRGITMIIHGECRGADSEAGNWARFHGIQEVKCPANWGVHENKAGPLRNRMMLLLQPDAVVAFPGGEGTADMVRAARDAGLKVWEPVK